MSETAMLFPSENISSRAGYNHADSGDAYREWAADCEKNRGWLLFAASATAFVLTAAAIHAILTVL